MEPLRAAALAERDQLDHRMFPMVAACWVAEGRSGEALLELAAMRGHEREVTELWPRALAELGAWPPSERRRDAMTWGAALVVDGERDLPWLTRLIWPDPRSSDDLELDELVYTIDDWLGWTERDLRSTQSVVRDRAESARRAVDRAVTAMRRADVSAAAAELSDWAG